MLTLETLLPQPPRGGVDHPALTCLPFRVKRLLMPSVPDPKDSFPGLFEHHRGDFQVHPEPRGRGWKAPRSPRPAPLCCVKP